MNHEEGGNMKFFQLQKALGYVFDLAVFNYPEGNEEAKALIDFAENAIFGNDWAEDNDGQIVIYTGVDGS